MTDNELIAHIANHLNKARDQGEGVSPVIDLKPEMTTEDAYEVQLYNVNIDLIKGNSIVGKKIGLTSKAMQESLGVDEPDYGHLLDSMVIDPEHPNIKKDQVLQPRVEGELAFILKEDLAGPNITTEDVLEATESIVAAIEIVDSRVKDWNITIKDTIADNGSSAYYILGDKHFKSEELDRINVKMQLFKNDELVNEGSGDAVLGDPAYCVAWLANKLHEFDITLKAGEVILSGALSAAVPAQVGDTFTCKFTEGLGDVSISFEE